MNKKVLTIIIIIDLLLTGSYMACLFTPVEAEEIEGWSKDIEISHSNAFGQDMVVEGSNIHVVWVERLSENSYIYYKRSHDNGSNWGINIMLMSGTEESWHPSISVWNNNIHVIWEQKIEGPIELMYIKSIDDGKTWEDTKQLTNIPNRSNTLRPSIAINGLNIHVVWQDNIDGHYGIYYMKSINNGESWNNFVLLGNSHYSTNPSIVAMNNNIHVVWGHNDGCKYINSTDNGNNWSNIKILDYNLRGNPYISYWGNEIHVTGDQNQQIYYIRSVDNGKTWDDVIQITDSVGSSIYPTIASSNTKIYIAYMYAYGSDSRIKLAKSEDRGQTWQIMPAITENTINAQDPIVGIGNNNVHITYNSDGYVYYKRTNIQSIAYIDSIKYKVTSYGQELEFIGHGSDSDGKIKEYYWESNLDGYLNHEKTFKSTSLITGNHTILFRVMDDMGVWSDDVFMNISVRGKPIAKIDSIMPNPAKAEEIVFFKGSGETIGNIVEYIWTSNLDGIISTSISFSASDLSIGNHTITFRVKDEIGIWSDNTTSVLTVIGLPIAIARDDSTVEKGTKVQFNGQGSDIDGTIVLFEWDFDGNGIFDWSSRENGLTTYIYNDIGTYNATLRVTDNDGYTSTDVRIITVIEKKEDDHRTDSLVIILIPIGIIIFIIIIIILIVIKKKSALKKYPDLKKQKDQNKEKSE